MATRSATSSPGVGRPVSLPLDSHVAGKPDEESRYRVQWPCVGSIGWPQSIATRNSLTQLRLRRSLRAR
jgi:hypothetical protein